MQFTWQTWKHVGWTNLSWQKEKGNQLMTIDLGPFIICRRLMHQLASLPLPFLFFIHNKSHPIWTSLAGVSSPLLLNWSWESPPASCSERKWKRKKKKKKKQDPSSCWIGQKMKCITKHLHCLQNNLCPLPVLLLTSCLVNCGRYPSASPAVFVGNEGRCWPFPGSAGDRSVIW